jgi:hypothetical protein
MAERIARNQVKPARPGLERKFFLNPYRVVHIASLETILKLKVAAKSCCYGIADSARNKRRYQSRAQAN